MCGVYYLFDGAAVLYIGASVDVERRIKEHASKIDFAGYFCDECNAEELNELEVKAIQAFNPPLNTQYI